MIGRLGSFYIAGAIYSSPVLVYLIPESFGLPKLLLAALSGVVALYYLLFALFGKPSLFFVPRNLTAGIMRLMTAGLAIMFAAMAAGALTEVPASIAVLLVLIVMFLLCSALVGVGFGSDLGDR